MRAWLRHPGTLVVGLLTALLVVAFVLIAVLFSRLRETRDDLARVEAGAALFGAQLQGFQGQLIEAAPSVADGLDEAIGGLEAFRTSTIEVTVTIDETVAIDTEIPVVRTVSVPVHETIPIRERIETTIRVDTPLGFTVPVDVTVPVDLDVPLDLDVTIPIDETVPVSAEVPVRLDVPIRIDVADTELAALADDLAGGLRTFRELVEGLGGG